MQDTSSLSWDDVKLFLAVFRARSLSTAAKQLGVDVSTTSRRLTRLEATVAASLFTRTRDGAQPTSYAEQLSLVAEQMEASAHAFSHQAKGFERDVEGVVRLTAPPGLLETFIVPVLPRLLAKHPKLRLELDARTAVADLSRQEADIALRTVPPQGAALLAKLAFTTHTTLAGSRRYVASLGRLSNLSKARFVGWAEPLTHLPLAKWLQAHVSPETVVLRSNSLGAQLEAAKAGLGLVLTQQPYVETAGLVEQPVSRELREALSTLPADKLWLVTHPALRYVPRVEAVWAFLDSHFAQRA